MTNITTLDTVSISGNSSHRGLSFFYNPVKIESILNVSKNISCSGFLELGNITLSTNENNEFTLHSQSDVHFNLGNKIKLSCFVCDRSELFLDSFSILNNFKYSSISRNNIDCITLNDRGFVGINNTSPSCSLDVSGKLKTSSLFSNQADIKQITTEMLSLTSDLEIQKERTVIFKQSNLDKPTLGTRSKGTKLVLLPSVSTSLLDYSIGLEQGHMWFSVPIKKESFGWKFYAGSQNPVCTLSATGNLNITGNLISSNITSGKTITSTYKLTWTKINDIVTFYIQTNDKSDIEIPLDFSPKEIVYDSKEIVYDKEKNTLHLLPNKFYHLSFVL